MGYKNFLVLVLMLTFISHVLMEGVVAATKSETTKRLHLRLDSATKGPFSGPFESQPIPRRPEAKSFKKEPPSQHHVTVLDQRRVFGMALRHRHYELSSEQLVVIAVDVQGQEIARAVVPDPRLIRAETITSSGELTSEILYQETADFTIVLPDDPRIISLKLYHPRWTGSKFILDLIGETQLP